MYKYYCNCWKEKKGAVLTHSKPPASDTIISLLALNLCRAGATRYGRQLPRHFTLLLPLAAKTQFSHTRENFLVAATISRRADERDRGRSRLGVIYVVNLKHSSNRVIYAL